MPNSVHVQPRAQNDWVVTQDGGRELGYYPTKVEAEAVGYKIARKRKVELLVHNGSDLRPSLPSAGNANADSQTGDVIVPALECEAARHRHPGAGSGSAPSTGRHLWLGTPAARSPRVSCTREPRLAV